MSNNRECNNCRHYGVVNYTLGMVCKRFPRQYIGTDPAYGCAHWRYPPMNSFDTCGEWKATEAAEGETGADFAEKS